MAILVSPSSRADEWMRHLGELLPDEALRLWPDVGDPADIDYLIAWQLPAAAFAELTDLAAILSLGAGTEQWQGPEVPDVPVVRLADPAMSDEMASYCVHWVVRFHRHFDVTEQLQRSATWHAPAYTATPDYHVGVLGFGEIGSRIGRAFTDLGYPVNAWSRTGGSTPGVRHFAGDRELAGFLAASDAVINVLPSTPQTRGLLDAARFAQFRADSVVVNVGRGNVIADESALLAALDDGPLRAAVLDVTDPEPPDPASPLFGHPAVTLTAHLSGETQIPSAARLIAANVARLRRGDAPFPVLDRTTGY